LYNFKVLNEKHCPGLFSVAFGVGACGGLRRFSSGLWPVEEIKLAARFKVDLVDVAPPADPQ